MKTAIPAAALADPDIALSNDIIRTCVHCGICLSHCPTYQVRHDENDSPRGRIILMRNMYEQKGAPDAKTVEHLDRCLTCLACEAICPSGVEYSKLIAHGREHVEATYRRPLSQRISTLTMLIPKPRLFRLGLLAGKLGQPFKWMFSGPLRAMLDMTPKKALPRTSPVDRPQVFPAQGDPPGAGHHSQWLRADHSRSQDQRSHDPPAPAAWCGGSGSPRRRVMPRAIRAYGAGGTGTAAGQGEHRRLADGSREPRRPGCHHRQYFRLRHIPQSLWPCASPRSRLEGQSRPRQRADERHHRVYHRIRSAAATDASRYAGRLSFRLLDAARTADRPSAYQPVRAAGFEVVEVPDGFMCCGSAGVYNLLQSKIVDELKRRKVANICSVQADVAASGNIGCMTQLSDAIGIPFVHTVELLDWATGGPEPDVLHSVKAPTREPEYRALLDA